MPDPDADALVQMLDAAEAKAHEQLTLLRKEEAELATTRAAALASAKARIEHPENHHLWGDPEAQARHVQTTLATTLAKLNLATVPHDETIRRIREVLDEIQRLQRQRETIESAKWAREAEVWKRTQASNVTQIQTDMRNSNQTIARFTIVAGIGAALAALGGIAALVVSLLKHCP